MRGQNKGLAVFCLVLVALPGVAWSQPPTKAPCQQITKVCENAGFKRGGAGGHERIVVDCVRPIMSGSGQTNSDLALPQVAPNVVAACRDRNPDFGRGAGGFDQADAQPFARRATSRPGATTSSPTGPGAPPVGLTTVIANKPGQPLNTDTFANPYIVGVALQIHWADIETQKDKPDWSRLDELVADAQAQNKFVQFFIFAGFFTPDWAQKGVQTDNFPVPYGPQHGKVLPLPMPWDDTYLTRWLAFVKLLSERYGNQPTVKIVAVAGPTSVSDEYTLPVSGPDVKQWETDGYTPSKYLGAWKRVLRAYAADFPNQYLSMSLGGGVDINDMGKFDPAQHKITQQAVATAAANILGDRFTLQYNNLDGKSGPEDTKGIAFVANYVGTAITGYQLRSAASGSGMGDPGMTPQQTMRAAFNKGINSMELSQRVDFLQVYQPDVLDPDLQTTLKWGASLFTETPPILPRHCGTHCM